MSDVSGHDPVQESVDAVMHLHRQHHVDTSPLQMGLDRVSSWVGKPLFSIAVALCVAGWIIANSRPGAIDPPPFDTLDLTATLLGLFVALLILVTQRHEDVLAAQRVQLTLELALLADRKTAKLISLLEEFRRDHPNVRDREDHESEQLAEPTDPKSVLDKIAEQSAHIGEIFHADRV